MPNSPEYLKAHREEIREYMRNYYLTHSTRPRMIPGAERQEKTCKRCGVTKPRSEYTVRLSGSRTGHLAAYCKSCMVKTQHDSQGDPGWYRRVGWPSKLRTLYGITVSDYERMLKSQGGGCAMCGTTDPALGSRTYRKRSREAFDVDHCHSTGKVRGLLCSRCNRLVGLAGDDLAVAQRLVTYLSNGGVA